MRAVDRELLAAHLGRDVIDLVEPERGVARLEVADTADEQPELELVADLHRAQLAREVGGLDQQAESRSGRRSSRCRPLPPHASLCDVSYVTESCT